MRTLLGPDEGAVKIYELGVATAGEAGTSHALLCTLHAIKHDKKSQ